MSIADRFIGRWRPDSTGLRRREVTPAPLSGFVLIRDGEAHQRLKVGEAEIPLNPGGDTSAEKHASRVIIQPGKDSMRLDIHFSNSTFISTRWGLLPKIDGSNETEWGVGLRDVVFEKRDRTGNIEGSGMHFNANATTLEGPGWKIEYSPLDS